MLLYGLQMLPDVVETSKPAAGQDRDEAHEEADEEDLDAVARELEEFQNLQQDMQRVREAWFDARPNLALSHERTYNHSQQP